MKRVKQILLIIDWEKLMNKVINFILENNFTKIGFIGSRNIDPKTENL